MKAQDLLLILTVVCLVVVVLLHLSSIQHGAYGDRGDLQMRELETLRKLVLLQNDTIHVLELHLDNVMRVAGSEVTEEDCSSGTRNRSMPATQHGGYGEHKPYPYREQMSAMEIDCEKRYGMELASEWRKSAQVWCEGSQGDRLQSQLTCYPYHQQHKILDGRGEDLFCEASNVVIDFSKVGGTVSLSGKPGKGSEYLRFGADSLLATCRKTEHYDPRLFMPHHSSLMHTFRNDFQAADVEELVEHAATTYLLARDEDCENSFHSTADFMNMFLVYEILGLQPSEVQVMLFDRFADGPYMELIRRAFSPSHPVLRHTHYRGKVRFRRLVFHLESPAGLIFPKVSRPGPLRCHRTSLFDSYRRFVLQSFDLLKVDPPAIPSVTLTLRHRTLEKNVGRVMANEKEVVQVLRSGNMIDVRVVDTAAMKFSEQLKLIRSTNVLIGIHGAGLMLIMFAAEEAVLVEVHPSYRQDRHFRHAARMTGKVYMPLRTSSRETCRGSSDSVTVPIDEFRTVVDGAVRIARSFDSGLSECGLQCPGGVLALDNRLDPYYKKLRESKVRPINTDFPC